MYICFSNIVKIHKMKAINYISLQQDLTIVNEPAMAYQINTVFGQRNLLDSLAESSIHLLSMVVSKTNLTIKTLAENIFEITPKTFIKYKNSETKLPSRLAELALELSIVYDLGIEVFSNVKEFNGWLDAENIMFLDKKPATFLNTSTGIRMLIDALKRIEFGATA